MTQPLSTAQLQAIVNQLSAAGLFNGQPVAAAPAPEVLLEFEDILELLARKTLGGDEAAPVLKWINSVREERVAEAEAEQAANVDRAAGAPAVAAVPPIAADPNAPSFGHVAAPVPAAPAMPAEAIWQPQVFPVPDHAPGADPKDAEIAALQAQLAALAPDPRDEQIAVLKAQLAQAGNGAGAPDPAAPADLSAMTKAQIKAAYPDVDDSQTKAAMIAAVQGS